MGLQIFSSHVLTLINANYKRGITEHSTIIPEAIWDHVSHTLVDLY